MYGEDAVTDRTCQRWFAKFHAGEFSLDDAPQSGRPAEVVVIKLRTINVIPRGRELTYSKYPNQ